MRVKGAERGMRHGMLASILAALLCAVLLTGCDPNKQNGGNSTGTTGTGDGKTTGTTGNEIVIGEYGSFTGPEADFGIGTDEGIKLAIEERNKAGGVKGKQVKLETEDDASDATKAETAVKRLIDEKKVIAVLGEVASGSSLAGGRICQERSIPMVSPSSTKPSVTEGRDYVFRVCFIDPYQAAVVARFARDGIKAKQVAIFTNKSQPYSVGFSEEFKKAFSRYGGKVVAEQSYSPSDQDFRGQLTALKAANPEAILIPGYYSDAGSIAKQARDIGINVPLLGGDGWDSQELIKIGGDSVNNCYFSNHMSIKDTNPKVQNFVKAYRDKYGRDPGALAALGYDAALVLMDAMERAPSLSPKDIRDALAQTKDFDGVTGKITMDANRNAQKSAVIIAVKNKQFEYHATIPDPEKPMQ